MRKSIVDRIGILETNYRTVLDEKSFIQASREVETMVNALDEKYNSPEEVAKRKAFYDEVCRIGELRRQAFERGESMEQYPLPWEKDKNPDEESWVQKIMDEVEQAVGNQYG